MRVLVCGGRKFSDIALLGRTLDRLHVAYQFTEVIVGGAPGADSMAKCWADVTGVPVKIFRARWKEEGLSAGPRRNQRMLDEGKPDIGVAFPGGAGTADMVRRARAAGIAIEVIEKR